MADLQLAHPASEQVIAAALDDLPADVFHHGRQLVGADVRAGIGDDLGRRSVLYQTGEDARGVAPFFGAGVQFPVRVGSGTPFAEAVIGIGIDDVLGAKCLDVPAARMHVLAPFQNDGPVTAFDSLQRCEHPGRTGTHDDDFLRLAHIGIFYRWGVLRKIVPRVHRYGNFDHRFTGTGVDRAAKYPQGIERTGRDPGLAAGSFPHQVGICRLGGGKAQLYFEGHRSS